MFNIFAYINTPTSSRRRLSILFLMAFEESMHNNSVPE